MRAEGLEPPRLSPRGPKPRASTSSATPAAARAAEIGSACNRKTGYFSRMAAGGERERRRQEERDAHDYVIDHPNRRKAGAKATKAVVVLLLLVSTGLMLI